MSEKRWLYFALGVTTVISIGAVTNQLVPAVPPDGLVLSESSITFPDGSVQTTASGTRRLFYLTLTEYQGGPDAGVGALNACDTGFHMASLWEIADVATVSYDFDNPSALATPDGGEGPPTGRSGWIRTGNDGTGTETVGSGNCVAWSTASHLLSGTVVRLPGDWSDPANAGSFALVWGTPWAAYSDTCDSTVRVWCVEDFAGASG